MRTNEERIAVMHKRAAELNKKKNKRTLYLAQVIGTAACLAVLVLLSFAISGISSGTGTETLQGNMSASIFSGSSVPGFVVIALVAFILGVMLTVFCFHLKRWQDEKLPGDKE